MNLNSDELMPVTEELVGSFARRHLDMLDCSEEEESSSEDEKEKVPRHERSFTEQEEHWNLRTDNDNMMLGKNITHAENAENKLREIRQMRRLALHCVNYESRASTEPHIKRGFEDYR